MDMLGIGSRVGLHAVPVGLSAEQLVERTNVVRIRTKRIVGIGLVAAAVSLQAWPAAAHGVHGPTPSSFLEYLVLGARHMLAGYDHLLFVGGLVILVSGLKDVVKFVTTFTVGHSLTLLSASLAGWSVNPYVIDVLIAISVAYVGAEIIWGDRFGRREDGQRLVALDPKVIVFAFGLLHGLGLATRLQAFGLPPGNVVGGLIGFNIGVEIGQVIALLALVGLAALLRRKLTDFDGLRRRAGAGLVVAGFAIATVLAGQAAL
jgi:HupE / UreJ protein